MFKERLTWYDRWQRYDKHGPHAWKRRASGLVWSHGQTTFVHPDFPLYLQELDVSRLLAEPVVYSKTTGRKREIDAEFGQLDEGKEGEIDDSICWHSSDDFVDLCSSTLRIMRLLQYPQSTRTKKRPKKSEK